MISFLKTLNVSFAAIQRERRDKLESLQKCEDFWLQAMLVYRGKNSTTLALWPISVQVLLVRSAKCFPSRRKSELSTLLSVPDWTQWSNRMERQGLKALPLTKQKIAACRWKPGFTLVWRCLNYYFRFVFSLFIFLCFQKKLYLKSANLSVLCFRRDICAGKMVDVFCLYL